MKNNVMDKKTVGIVIGVYKQWWLKVNTKAIRMGALDGATFPHIIKVKYCVNGLEYTKYKWLSASVTPPKINSELKVVYDENNPKKAKIIYVGGQL